MNAQREKRGYSQRILGGNAFKSREFTDVLIMEPFDFEVKIHVFCTFTVALLIMLWKED